MTILEALAQISALLGKEKVDFALIGGLALHAQGVSRATTDVDALILVQDKEKVREILARENYSVFYESSEVVTFLSSAEKTIRLDFLLAQRPYARAMLERAETKEILPDFHIKVARPEDLIGLKIQAATNDPTRKDQDMADIRSLLRVHHATLEWPRVREYFSLFQAESDLDRLLKEEGLAPHP